MAAPSPSDTLVRSPLAKALAAAAATWRPIAGSMIADEVKGAADPTRLAIVDLSPLPRLGFKGRGTIPAMQARGIVCEPKANQAYRQPDGTLCLVLAASEVILLGDLAGQTQSFDTWENAWRIEDGERTYPLKRRDSHAWLLLTGRDVPQMFAKLCAIDLRLHKFPNLAIAQTSVAKMTAIVTRADIGATPAFHLLADSASALYLSSCLRDAAQEFGGGLAGLREIEKLGAYEKENGRGS